MSPIYTYTSHQLNSTVRGIRTWSAAEIESAFWYQLEYSLGPELKCSSFITTDIYQVFRLKKATEQAKWRILRLYLRDPFLNSQGFVFEIIEQIHVSPDGRIYLMLASGQQAIKSNDGWQVINMRPV
jgi:hypothetical protein